MNTEKVLKFSLGLILFVLGVADVAQGRRRCRSSSDRELRMRRAELMYVYESNLRVPPLSQKFEAYSRHYRSSLPDTCPEVTQTELDLGDVSATSSCPWEIEQDTKANRFPRTIPFAKCKCTDCRGDPDSSCEMIWQNIVVLRHNGTCVDGHYAWKPFLEPVSVGCTCTARLSASTSRPRSRWSRSLMLGAISGE